MIDEVESYLIPKGEPMTPGTWFLSTTGPNREPIILASCPKCQAMNEIFGPENRQFILNDGKCKLACQCGVRALIQLQDYAGY